MITSNKTVSVIIVTYFTGPSLWKCLDSCLRSDVGQIIIVSNGNQLGTLKKLREFKANHPCVDFLEGHGNVGFSKACNLGANKATGEHLMFLNPDAVLHPFALKNLKDALAGQPMPSVAGARLLNPDGTEQRGSRRGELTLWSALVSMSGLSRFEHVSSLFSHMHWERRELPATAQNMPALSGACLMFRASDFAAVSGFDERYFLHVEDIDICRTVRKKGGNSIFVPSAEITHIGSTSQANIFRVNWSKSIGLIRYFYKFSTNSFEQTIVLLLAPAIIGTMMLRTFWAFIQT